MTQTAFTNGPEFGPTNAGVRPPEASVSLRFLENNAHLVRSRTDVDQREQETLGTLDRASVTNIDNSMDYAPSFLQDRRTATATTTESVRTETVIASAEWDGRVTSIGRRKFVGTMAPVGSRPGTETEELTYPLAMLSSTERRNLQVGSIFRFTVGQSRTSSGKPRPHASVYFRPASAIQDVRARQTVNELSAFFSKAREATSVSHSSVGEHGRTNT